MKPEIKLDARQWVAAARALKETSSRTTVDFINGQALRVVSLALKETAASDAGKIARELGAAARSVSFKTISKGKNKGTTRTVRGNYILAGNDTLAHRILTARKSLTGGFGIKGETLEDKAMNLIKARIVSVNFIRSGWIPAIRTLSSVVRKKPAKLITTRQGVRMRGVPKGSARPAVFSLRSVIQAMIENTALNKKPVPPETKGDPMKPAKVGLQKALNLAAQDMIAELARRLNPDFKRASGK